MTPSGQPITHARCRAWNRAKALQSIDVIIIGAGINGAGTFRDLCVNGVSCLLVDREDFGAGATNGSSRIAHGGLRYLETGQIRLVAEATLERNRLLQNAPHYVKPLLITIPSFSRFGGMLASMAKLIGKTLPMRSRGVALVKIGLVTYDWLGRNQRSLPGHTIHWRAAALRLLPGLNSRIAGISSYYDARITHTERLAFELVAQALNAHPQSHALNHVAVVAINDGSLVLRDEIGGETFTVRPRIMVNAGGAWIDRVNGAIGQADQLIGGTKGTHIMVRNETLRYALAGRAFSFDDGEGRMCVAYEAFGLVMIGTSDIRIDNPDDASCSESEIDYFLDKIRIVFPDIAVRRDEVRYAFVGVRPLPHSGPGATVNISRDHSFKRHEPTPARPFPVLSLIGGKWTTFRAFSEQAADRVFKEIGATRRQTTTDLVIGGGKDYPRSDADQRVWIAREANVAGVPAERMEVLLQRYGTAATLVARFCASPADPPLIDAPTYTEGEVRYLIRCEMTASILDIVTRRTTLALEGALTLALLRQIARLLLEESDANDFSVEAVEAVLHPAVAYFRKVNAVDPRLIGAETLEVAGQI